MSTETPEKFLEIAELLNRYKNESGAATLICKELKVSGHTVGKVKRMIKNGLIAFKPDGTAYFTVSLDQLEDFLEGGAKEIRTLSPEQLARRTVTRTFQRAIADESKTQTEQYLILGKAIWQAVSNYLIRKGYTIEDIRKTPIHKTIIEALEKADAYEQILPEYRRLKEENAYLKEEIEPLVRLRKVMTSLPEMALYLLLLEEAGFNIEPIIKTLNRQLNLYVTGTLPNA